MCTGLDLKDAFLHVPMSVQVNKFLRFTWRGKLYEWEVLQFGLKCCPRIFMDNFTNQARCRCKAIFQIHLIALVFMCCGWSINWMKTILEPTGISPSRFPLGHLEKVYRLTRGQNHQGGSLGQEAPHCKENHPGGPRMFCGNSHQHYPCCLEGFNSL